MSFEEIKQKKPVDVVFEMRGNQILWSYMYDDGSEDSVFETAPFAMSTDPKINKSRMDQFKKDKLAEAKKEI